MDNQNIQMEEIRAVILIGPLDFGRCSLASRIPPALWPMPEKPAIENIIGQLANQGIKKVTICSKVDDRALYATVKDFADIETDIIVDKLPAGTAGSIRDAARDKKENKLVILPGSMAVVPNIQNMLATHQQTGADLTMAFHKTESNDQELTRSADIFICNREILDYIPSAGYFDLKEHLIPLLVKDDKKIYPLQLDQHTGSFRNVPAYIAAMSKYLSTDLAKEQYPQLKTSKRFGDRVLIGENCNISETLNIHGPVIIFDNVEIGENAIVIGPAVIGSQVWIGHNCLISDSFLWQGCGIWPRTKIQNSVISYDTEVKSDIELKNGCVTSKKEVSTPDNTNKTKLTDNLTLNFKKKVTLGLTAFILLLAALIISYFSTITELFYIWTNSDEYSAGMLVPFLAGYVLWVRRSDLCSFSLKPTLWGILALIFAQLVRFGGLYLDMAFLERISLVFTIGAGVLLITGWRLTFKLAPIIAFLLLMVPLPNQFNMFFSLKLQEWATTSAVWTLEMLGYVVKRDGNIIHLGDTTVAVAEACNGLRMIMAFFIIAGWFALLVNRKTWEKMIIFASALPISILCNTIRLAITAIAFTMINEDRWAEVFHDYGGYAMMPLAIGIIIGELWVLRNIFIVEQTKKAQKSDKETVIIRKTS